MPWEKRLKLLTVRLGEAEKEEFAQAAAKRGMSMSDYVRRLHETASGNTDREVASEETRQSTREVRHVEDIGPDPLWSGRRALER